MRTKEQQRLQNLKQRQRPGWKEAHAKRMREWRIKSPRLAKSADLKKSFGITIADYDEMLARQQGVCAVCHRAPGKKALAVDHNHATGKVRSLLCHGCNTAIGLLDENPERCRLVAQYLESHQPPSE